MPSVDRSRQPLLLAAAVAAAVVVTVVIAAQTTPGRPVAHAPDPSGATRSLSDEASGGAGPPTIQAVPAIDPQPWAAVAWRGIPGAFGKNLEPGLDRVDGLIAGGPGLIGWGRVHQPRRNQFNDMAAVHLSTDGVGWAVIPVDAGVGPPDTSEIQLVATGPAGIVLFGDVCCTKEERALWRSADGRAWERLPYPAVIGPTDELTRLMATADLYVLAGRSNGAAAIWTSRDGAAWSAVDGAAAGFGPGSIADVARTASGFVAAGYLDVAGTYDGAVWTSPDGEHWTRVAADILTGKDDTAIQKVVVWAGGWFLVGLEGPHAERVRCEQLGLAGQLASIDRPVDLDDGPRLDLSCGWGSEVHWLTADGTTWQRVAPAGSQGGVVAKRGELIEFRLVAAGGPGLVVLGEGSDVGAASIFVSADGVHWVATVPDEQFPVGIVPAGFVIGGRVLAAVADGPSAWIGTVR
jgi:hypothetical protein